MRGSWCRGLLGFGVTLLVGAVAVGCAQPQADAESLRASFAERIASSDFVDGFSSDRDELSFAGPDGNGGTATWSVRIETAVVEPNEFDETSPYQGRVVSEWRKDGEIVEYLGTMTALPMAFLDRGLAQECWAYWIETEHRWDW
jgi:hypothetical protein